MKIKVEVPIRGTNEDIWKVITDIENSAVNITGIEKVEIHINPGENLVGLKWTETRTLFGKTATETMWITEAEKINITRQEQKVTVLYILLTCTFLKKMAKLI
jgi:hypothetical protein